jgi:hypothetical protein
MKYKYLYLLIAALLIGTIAITTNIVDPREQKFINFAYLLLLSPGVLCCFIPGCRILAPLLLFVSFIAYRMGISWEALTAITGLSFFFIAIVYTYPQWEDKKGAIYDTLIVIAGLNLLWQALQYFGVWWPMTPLPGQHMYLVGLMCNVDETFALYMICFPAFLRRRRWQLLIPVIIAGLVLSSPLISSPFKYVISDHLNVRLSLWGMTLTDSMPLPLAGHGFMPYLFNVPIYGYHGEAHNEFIEWFWRGGIIGMGLFIWTSWRLFISGFKATDKLPVLGLLCSFVASTAFFTWHILPLALITVAWGGLIAAQRREIGAIQ